MTFSEILNWLLEQNKKTAYRMAKETGISESLIGYWRRGQSIAEGENLKKVADYFGVSVDYLLGRDKIEDAPDVVAFHVNHAGPLTDEEKEEVDNYIRYLISKRKEE